MKQVIQNFRTGKLKVEEVPRPSLLAGSVRVRNVASLISAGTERSTVDAGQSNLVGKARKRPDLVKQVVESARRDGLVNTYKKVMTRLDSPKMLGYSSAGVVLEVARGVDNIRVGDRVACAGGQYACHAEEIVVPKNLCCHLPDTVGFDEAAYGTVGAIAMQGVRQAKVAVGDNVAVIGLGLIGLITVQILNASGCRVAGFDIDEMAIELAVKLGAAAYGLVGSRDAEDIVSGFTGRVGFDSVLLTASTTSNAPIELAGDIARDRAKVVIVGAVGANLPRSPYYEKEIDVRFSRSYGPGRYDTTYEEKGVDYPVGYVRWTEQRNIDSFVGLVSAGKIDLGAITTHTFPIDDAADAYKMITGADDERYVGVLIKYGENGVRVPAPRIFVNRSKKVGSAQVKNVSIGFIGAGNFAQSSLLPHLQGRQDVTLRGVVTARGANSRMVAEKFGFDYCADGFEDLLADSEIDTVFVATRHSLHAQLVIDALRKGKNVFVEKPLALSADDLEEVAKEWADSNSELMVGFNRRFAPQVVRAHSFFEGRRGPMIINYRVNAGYLPSTHWTHDPDEGGRVLGEACHFIDLAQFFVGHKPTKVYADSVSDTTGGTNEDNSVATVKFEDGSLAVITYVANGDKALPKERVEILADQKAAVIDDFKRLHLVRDGKSVPIRAGAGKGHKEEISAFIASIVHGQHSAIPADQLLAASFATLAWVDSMSRNRPIDLVESTAGFGRSG